MAAGKLVAFGDSVTWGQGLLPDHKFAAIVAAARGLTLDLVAHSGATIGIRGPDTELGVDGEIPVPFPTAVEQLENYAGDVNDAALILITGGINDVDIRRILNPITRASELRQKIELHCHDDMLALLLQACRRFSNPAIRIIVAGYFPILSPDSQLLRIPFLLACFGIGVPPLILDHGPVFEKIVSLCVQFFTESTDALRRAVTDCNAALGVNRVTFVPVPFTARNAVFASEPWLWGLSGDFSPQDEVILPRRGACTATIDPFDLLGREVCFRASAGHPNVRGALEYGRAIAAVL